MDPALIQRVNELRAQLAHGEREEVEAGLRALPSDLPAALRRRAADLWVALERWEAATELLEPCAGQDARTEMKLTFMRNMAAAYEARPELYAAMRELDQDRSQRGRFRVDDRLRICARLPDGGYAPLVEDPIARAEGQWDSVLEAAQTFGSVGLVGIGDGYLLAALSNTDFGLPNGMTQPVLIIEPDLELLRTVFELHDLSQPDGLLHDPRGLWCIGTSWKAALRERLVTAVDTYLPRTFLIGWASPETQSGVLDVVEAYRTDNAAVEERLLAQDVRRTPAVLLELLGDAPPRKPRAFFVTSDFTRVLKHATRNLADTFEGLGWETMVLTEGAPWARLPRLKIRREIERFDPDVAVIVNHARAEYGSMYPPNLPFITWVQDQMPNLEQVEVGRSMHGRDFVMTGMNALVDHYEYPARQVVRMRCLAKPRLHRPAAIAPRHDLVYVSHCSLGLDKLREQVEFRMGKHGLDVERGRRTFDAVVDHYRAGGSIPHSRALIEFLSEHTGLDPDDADEIADWVGLASYPNIVLYRQQALGWVADVADARGMDLAVYGKGWETSERFAPYAKGEVAYGDALDALQRRARFNLILEPFPMTSHWRGLDCMAAGAMPLVRRHPYPGCVAGLARWLDAHGLTGLERLDEVRAAAVTPVERRELDGLVEGFSYLGILGDPVAFVRKLRQSGARDLDVPPGIGQVSFGDPRELSGVIDRFFEDEAARAELIEPMRAFTLQHLSYEAGVRHLLGFMRARIGSEPALDTDRSATAGAA